MKISIVGCKDYVKDSVIKGVTVYGVELEEIRQNGYGCKTFKQYFRGMDGSNFEIGGIYDVEFEHIETNDGYKAFVSGLRKED